ncbi:MAG: peptidyl-prolyl cis-trans isomerase [Ignavibacteriales bacterium]|nr:peptidyl-prolyl cis-trans isomerase [Ignavibacteriales bacterium]
MILFSLFLGCDDKPKEEDKIIARVDEQVLDETELNDIMIEKRYEKKFREEYVRQWIERELLYREALKQNILENKEFQRILDITKKEIANSFFLEKYFRETNLEAKELELKEYFEKYKLDFAFNDEIYVLNIVQFVEEDIAINYRNTFIDKGWDKFNKQIANDTSIYFKGENIFISSFQIQPIELLNAVKALNPGEVSIVVESEPKIFTIVQLVQFYDKGKLPDYSLVSSQVEDRFKAEKKQKLYKELIENLYLKYNVEIK